MQIPSSSVPHTELQPGAVCSASTEPKGIVGTTPDLYAAVQVAVTTTLSKVPAIVSGAGREGAAAISSSSEREPG
jgi:hypothetical protein